METQEIIFKVIWVDDQMEKLIDEKEGFFEKPVQIDGLSYRLDIQGVTCWDKAEKILWSSAGNDIIAVILDAKCKITDDKKEDKLDMTNFLFHATNKLSANFKIPYFIYSGSGDDGETLKIDFWRQKDDPDIKWKEDNGRGYYSKTIDGDRIALKENIIAYGRRSQQAYKIKKELYRDLFRCISELKMNPFVEEKMVDLLVPFHFGEIENMKYLVDKVNVVRKIIEYIFKSMTEKGMLPHEYANDNNQVNIHGSFTLLINCFIPKPLKGITKNISFLLNEFHHAPKGNDTKSDNDIISYQENVKSNFLLKSIVFWLCDFIKWYYWHSNYSKEENIEKVKEYHKEGYLVWDKMCSRWMVNFDKEYSKVDSHVPGYNNPETYRNNQLCKFYLNDNKYACDIKIINK